MITDKNFSGRNGFYWFTGVVEDRHDPQYLGRVRVRCIGLHTDDKVELPTADLPWASCVLPTMEESKSPESLTAMFNNVENNGAPWAFPAANRANWITE